MRKGIGFCLALLFIASIVSYSADSPKPSEEQIRELLLAVRGANAALAEDLLTQNPSLVNAENSHGITPLMIAIFDGQEAMVKLLVSRGANVNAKDGPLGSAAYEGQIGMMECLISQGAEIDGTNYWGGTPLSSAAEGGRLEAARLLIARGAKVNVKNDFGATPLVVAVSNGHASVAKFLIERGADVTQANEHGVGPLHRATSAYVATLLISKGANVNAADENGLTPLHVAAFHGLWSVAKILIAKGADPSAKTTATANLERGRTYADVVLPAGMTPRDLAEKAGQTEVAKLLAQAEAGR